MAAWSGFTDDDLRKMRHTSQTDELSTAKKKALLQRQQLQHKGQTLRSSRLNSNPDASLLENADKISPSMKLSTSDRSKVENRQVAGSVSNSLQEKKTREVRRLSSEEEKGLTHGEKDDGKGNGTAGDESSVSLHPHTHSESCDIKELNEQEALSVELSNVQKFQQQQKVIEEANKRKRALLAKAIDDRRKKAKAEAEKLLKVQQELQHLDSLLTADITIIRDRIEAASLDYMEAQKRYEKAEREFVAAKMDLFSKGEAKEHLTEHLYTIIHQNEVRKAKKLVELMEKLAMDVTPEEMELTIPAIPQLTNFTAVSTIHDPHHVRTSGAIEQEKINAADVVSTGEVTHSESTSQEIKDAVCLLSTDSILNNNYVYIGGATAVDGLGAGDIVETHSSESVHKETYPPQQLNEIVQSHTASESNLNNHTHLPVKTTGVILHKVDLPDNTCPSTTLDSAESEMQNTVSAISSQDLGAKQDNPHLSGSPSTGTNSPGIQVSSSNGSSAKGWMLPFS